MTVASRLPGCSSGMRARVGVSVAGIDVGVVVIVFTFLGRVVGGGFTREDPRAAAGVT